jgi:serine protease
MGIPRTAGVAVAVCLSTVSGAFASSATAESAAAWATSPRTVVVGYRTQAELAVALRGLPVRIVRKVPALRVAELATRVPAATLAARLASRPGIVYAQPLAARRHQAELGGSAASAASLQWSFVATREDSVPDWVLRAASSVTIAIVDTGADLSAPDLAAKAPSVFDVLAHGGDVRDLNGHGTFVASIAAGSVADGSGVSGFGGDAKLLVVRAGRPDGTFTDVDEAAGIVYAVDHGARIVNLSIGGPTTSTTEQRAIGYAVSQGVLLVAAAGNEHQQGNPTEYPAALLQPAGPDATPVGLAVAASTPDGGHAAFSNTGSYVSVAAPGVDVLGALSASSSPAL